MLDHIKIIYTTMVINDVNLKKELAWSILVGHLLLKGNIPTKEIAKAHEFIEKYRKI